MGLGRVALNIDDFRRLARSRLPNGLFDYIDRGSEDDVAVCNNRESFVRLRLRPRVLAGVANRSLTTNIMGKPAALPIGIAPMGAAGYLWYRGENALANAAAAAGIPFVLSGATSVQMRDVIGDTGAGDKWFQLYMSGDRGRSLQVVKQALSAGFSTLVLTADSFVPYKREFAVRSGFDIPFRLRPASVLDILAHPRWLVGTAGRYLVRGRLPAAVHYPIPGPGEAGYGRVALKDDSIDWGLLGRLREMWPGKLIVKGVLDPRDAELCIARAVDGIVVSNHGGIALDAAISPIQALPDIVAVVAKRISVMLDGGVRRGSDVIKALALGADAVFLGRALLYALAAGGEKAVGQALALLRDEMDRTLALLGCRTLTELTSAHVVADGNE